MKINNINAGQIRKIYEQQEKESPAGGEKGPKADRMNISSQAKEIRELQARLAEMPEIRREKVEKIKTALSNNTYHVNSEKIAEKMLAGLEQSSGQE